MAALRWGAAVLVVAALHAGAGWWVARQGVVAPAPPDAPQGIPIDLEPVAVPQSALAPDTTAAAGPATLPAAAAQPAPAPAPEVPRVEPPPPELPAPQPETPSTTPEPALLPAPEPLPDPAVAAPVLPRKETTDATLSLPLPAPPRPRPKSAPASPDPRRLAREAAERRAAVDRRAAQRAAQRAARTAVRSAPAQEAGGQSTQPAAALRAASGAAVATWRGAVIAHLNAFRPSAPGGASGTARVAFSVDSGGRVVAASLAGSSGDPGLDEAAVAMIRRASPVPAPPPELGGRIALAVPVRFH